MNSPAFNGLPEPGVTHRRQKRADVVMVFTRVALQVLERGKVLGPGERERPGLIADGPQECALNVRNVMEAVANRPIVPRLGMRANRAGVLGIGPDLMIVEIAKKWVHGC